MTKQVVNRGAAVDDPTAENLYTAFGKVNDNTSELYTFLGGSTLTQTAGGVLLGNGTGAITSFLTTSNRSLWGAGASGIDDDPWFVRTADSGRYIFGGGTDNGVALLQVYGYLSVQDRGVLLSDAFFGNDSDWIGLNNGTNGSTIGFLAGGGVAPNGAGGGVLSACGSGIGTGEGGVYSVAGGNGGATANGGGLNASSGNGGATSGNAGPIQFVSGTVTNGDGGYLSFRGGIGVGTNKNGGDVAFSPGSGTGTGAPGYLSFLRDNGAGTYGIAAGAGTVARNANGPGAANVVGQGYIPCYVDGVLRYIEVLG